MRGERSNRLHIRIKRTVSQENDHFDYMTSNKVSPTVASNPLSLRSHYNFGCSASLLEYWYMMSYKLNVHSLTTDIIFHEIHETFIIHTRS